MPGPPRQASGLAPTKNSSWRLFLLRFEAKSLQPAPNTSPSCYFFYEIAPMQRSCPQSLAAPQPNCCGPRNTYVPKRCPAAPTRIHLVATGCDPGMQTPPAKHNTTQRTTDLGCASNSGHLLAGRDLRIAPTRAWLEADDYGLHGQQKSPKSLNYLGLWCVSRHLRTSVDSVLVAWDGIEPPTRGFSIRCSTN